MEAIQMPETSALKMQSLTVLEQANKIAINDNSDYQGAGEFLKIVKGLAKQVTETFRDPKRLAMETHRAICASESKHLDPLERSERIVKNAMSCYLADEEKKRIAEAVEARKLQEKQDAIERARIEEERLSTAQTLSSMGLEKEAMEVIEKPIIVQSLTPMSILEKPKAAGISGRKKYIAVVTNEALIPAQYRVVDLKKIQKVVDAMGPAANIPGVSIREEFVISSRTGTNL